MHCVVHSFSYLNSPSMHVHGLNGLHCFFKTTTCKLLLDDLRYEMNAQFFKDGDTYDLAFGYQLVICDCYAFTNNNKFVEICHHHASEV